MDTGEADIAPSKRPKRFIELTGKPEASGAAS